MRRKTLVFRTLDWIICIAVHILKEKKETKMATSGVPFEPPINDITNAIKKFEGVLSEIARHYKVHRSTIYEYIEKHPELKEEVKKAREHYIESMCDAAEQTIQTLIRDKEEKAVALKAAQYALNNQGRKRHYNHPEVEAAERSLGLLDKAKTLKILPSNDNTQSSAQ